jgi:hypothetical protein
MCRTDQLPVPRAPAQRRYAIARAMKLPRSSLLGQLEILVCRLAPRLGDKRHLLQNFSRTPRRPNQDSMRRRVLVAVIQVNHSSGVLWTRSSRLEQTFNYNVRGLIATNHFAEKQRTGMCKAITECRHASGSAASVPASAISRATSGERFASMRTTVVIDALPVSISPTGAST